MAALLGTNNLRDGRCNHKGKGLVRLSWYRMLVSATFFLFEALIIGPVFLALAVLVCMKKRYVWRYEKSSNDKSPNENNPTRVRPHYLLFALDEMLY